MAANADLREDIWETLRELTVDFQICHVPSHEDLQAHTDLADRWVLAQNQYVDRLAMQANLARDDEFWQVYELAQEDYFQQEAIQQVVVDFRALRRFAGRRGSTAWAVPLRILAHEAKWVS